MNFEFSLKLGIGHLYQHVPEEYKAYCLIEPKKQAYSVNFEKCTFEKIVFKVFEGYRDEKNSYLSTTYTNLAEI